MADEATEESNTIDLILTNHPTCFNRVKTIPVISDHDIVFAEIHTIISKQTWKSKDKPI